MLTKEEQKELEELEKLEKSGALELNSGLSKEEEKELAYLEELEKNGELNLPEGPVDDRTDEAALEGLGQGLTFGYLSQLQAKMEPVTDRVFNAITGNDVEPADWDQLTTNNEEYLKSRDANIKRNKELKEKNPVVYGGSEILGNVITGVAGSGIMPGAAATAKGRALQAGAMGLAYGALSNPGDVEGVINEVQVGPRLKNALYGALTGYGAQAGIDKIAKHSKPLAEKILKAAHKRAAKAMGWQKSHGNKFTQEQIDEAGKYALDNDLLEINLWNNSGKMAEKNQKVMEKAGKGMSEVYDAIDEAGASKFNPVEVADEVDNQLGGFWRDPINKAEAKQFDNTIETILNRGNQSNPSANIPLNEAQALKKKLGKVANWKNSVSVSDKEKMARDAYRVVSEQIDEAVEKGAKEIGNTTLLNDLTRAKKDYAAGKTAEELIENLIKKKGNRSIGLMDIISMGAGAQAFGGPPGAIAAFTVKKLSDTYGSKVAARALDKIGKTLMKTPSLARLANTKPTAFQAVVYRFAEKAESTGVNSAKGLMKAAETELKGKEKWTMDGLDTVSGFKGVDLENPEHTEKLLMTKKGEALLRKAARMKKNKRGMASLKKEIQDYLKEGEK